MFDNIKRFMLLSLVLIAAKGYALPADMKVMSDIAYGKDADQTLDVYMPAKAKDAPVIFMVHGGAWSGGDKAHEAEFKNKVAHWVSRGFVFISTNYRTLPKMRPVEQTQDIEAALLFSQNNAREWGGSAKKFILMGHSSGAHLISLVSSNYPAITGNGVMPWLGTVSLDISGYDIVKKVTGANPSKFYKEKFGESPDYLAKASPFYAVTEKIPPFLAVCSLRSADACTQAENFLAKVKKLGAYAQLLPVDLSHRKINSELGKDACYTNHVDDFLKKLSPAIAPMLSNQAQEKCAGS